jgi:hypothetical protein
MSRRLDKRAFGEGSTIQTPMPRPPTPAQIAIQVTFVLKGHLKNVQVAYVRAASLLARVRDEKLWQALKHATIEDYAAERLGLQRAALYRYLQIHDWLREEHPAWLAPRPKGFIPELSDAYALMWIEHRLRDPHLEESLRRQLEALRKKALVGRLTEREFRAVRDRGRVVVPLRALVGRLRSLRRFASGVPKVPAATLEALDAAIRSAEGAIEAAQRVARFVGVRPRIKRSASG